MKRFNTVGKLLNFPPSDHPGGPPGEIILVAGLLELIGGALVSVGLFTRVVAFVLSGEMAVAYFTAHFPHSFYPAINQGDAAILFCFVFLYLAAAGAGPISIDAKLGGTKAKA